MTWTPRAMIDFDGVIHTYSRGWDDGTAYDVPMPGAVEGLKELEDRGYEVVIFSTRDAQQIQEWLVKHGLPPYRVTNIKEPAQFYLDDRAIRFNDWETALYEIKEWYI